MKNRHPYELKKRLRALLPWALIDIGIAAKGKDCKLVNANHSYYKIDETVNGCYYCEQQLPRDPKLTKNDCDQEIIAYIDDYLSGKNTAREIYDRLKKEDKLKYDYNYQFVSDLSSSIGINVFSSDEFKNYFKGATRLGIINLIERYQEGLLSELEIEKWSDANECWTIVEKTSQDNFVQNLISEFGFGELHLKEMFTDKEFGHIKLMLKRKENSEIEDFKLTTVFSHHKRRLANALTELKTKNSANQLESYINEKSKFSSESVIVQELIERSSSEIDDNVKLIERLINDYVNGEWKPSI